MPAANYTIEENIEILKRTKIKTIVAEGVDDLEILRTIEAKIKSATGEINFIIAGSKDAVLQIWGKRDLFKTAPIGFLADSDMWLFDSKTQNYPGIIFTEGYSVENISIQNDCFLQLIEHSNALKISWNNALLSLAKWFAAEVAFYLKDSPPILDLDVSKILNEAENYILSEEATARIQNCPKEQWDYLLQKIEVEPLKFIRGKQLFRALHLIINRNESVNFQLKVLKAMGVRLENPHVINLIDALIEATRASSEKYPISN